jgi:hypothetical protein
MFHKHIFIVTKAKKSIKKIVKEKPKLHVLHVLSALKYNFRGLFRSFI